MKSIEQCREAIAKKWKYKSWQDIHIKVGGSEMDAFFDEAAELYASQFKLAVIPKNDALEGELLQKAKDNVAKEFNYSELLVGIVLRAFSKSPLPIMELVDKAMREYHSLMEKSFEEPKEREALKQCTCFMSGKQVFCSGNCNQTKEFKQTKQGI